MKEVFSRKGAKAQRRKGRRKSYLRLHHHCWNILITYELVERRHIASHQLRELLQLRVNPRDHFIIHRIRLRGRGRFRTRHHTAERREFVVQTDREVQRILAALVLRLVERLFNRRQVLVQRRARVVDDFEVRLSRQALQQILNLFAHVANLNDRIVRLSQLVANLQPEFELLRVIRRRRTQTRVRFDLERLRVALAVDSQFHLIFSGRESWTTCLACPKNHSREPHGIGISHVPHKTVETNIRRYGRRSTTAAEKSFTRRLRRRRRGAFTLLIRLRRKLSNRLPCRI